MSGKIDGLRAIFRDVAEEPTLTEHQQTDVSHDPIDQETAELEAEVSGFARDDGLDDAVDVELGASDTFEG